MPNACVASVGRSANLRQHGDDTRHLIAEAHLLPVAGERDGMSAFNNKSQLPLIHVVF
jgi:hypothetical protein